MEQTVFIISTVGEALGSFETSALIYELTRPNLTEELSIQNSYLIEQAARIIH